MFSSFKNIPVISILTLEFIYAICWYILQGVLPIYWQYWWDTLYIYICGLQNVFGSASLRVEAITHATLGCFLVSSIIGGYVNHVPSGQSKVLKQLFFFNFNLGLLKQNWKKFYYQMCLFCFISKVSIYPKLNLKLFTILVLLNDELEV